MDLREALAAADHWPSLQRSSRETSQATAGKQRVEISSGGMIAVTLMSSDMGKLYAALAQAIDRRR